MSEKLTDAKIREFNLGDLRLQLAQAERLLIHGEGYLHDALTTVTETGEDLGLDIQLVSRVKEMIIAIDGHTKAAKHAVEGVFELLPEIEADAPRKSRA